MDMAAIEGVKSEQRAA